MDWFALIHIRLCFVLYRLLACVIAVLWLQTLFNLSKIINDIVGEGSLKVFSFAESLGGVESLITYPTTQTHADIPAEVRHSYGLTDDLLRLSIGIEDARDLIADLRQALEG